VLTEDEKAEYRKKVNALMAQKEAEPKQEADRLNHPGLISAERMKKVIDDMAEIDSDPASEKAKAYYKKLAEIERTNKKKRNAVITIKTIKRGKTLGTTNVMLGADGLPLSEQEIEFQKKYVDFTNERYIFPEVNPVNLQVPDYKEKSKLIKLANYRWPCADPSKRKGVVQWVHGYGDYSARFGYLGQEFSKAGFDFIAIDQRGYGHSEGRPGIGESESIIIDDQI
jgi:hypothetical protein